MKNDDWLWLLGIGAFIIIGALGGFKNPDGTGLFSVSTTTTPAQKQINIQQEINKTEAEVARLQKQIQAEQEKKNASVYKDIVDIRYVNRSTDPKLEYIVLQVVGKTPEPINITGWTLMSTSSGASVKIPKSTYLFFTGTTNTEEDVYVQQNDSIYIITGISPNGYGFKVNKCSGYLTQFQTWNPSINYRCPLARNEDLSSIPRLVVNDACFDYIDRFPQCRIQTTSLPQNWSYECVNFIYSKMNYPSCINTHKNDKDFYSPEWRIYLKRSEKLWKSSRETIVLYDSVGKVVDTLKY